MSVFDLCRLNIQQTCDYVMYNKCLSSWNSKLCNFPGSAKRKVSRRAPRPLSVRLPSQHQPCRGGPRGQVQHLHRVPALLRGPALVRAEQAEPPGKGGPAPLQAGGGGGGGLPRVRHRLEGPQAQEIRLQGLAKVSAARHFC